MAVAVVVVRGGGVLRPHIETMAIGAHFIHRHDRACACTAKCMARRAVGLKYGLAFAGERLIDWEGESRWLHVTDVVLNPTQARHLPSIGVVPFRVVAIDPFRRRAIANG